MKCLAFIKGQGKNGVCHKPIPGSSKGVPAPCFFAERSHRNGVMPQYAYFCPTYSCHTWTPDNALKPWPPRPSVWPVAQGTNLTVEEVSKLKQGGYMVEEKVILFASMAEQAKDNNAEVNEDVGEKTGLR